jgi:hypothetical protein
MNTSSVGAIDKVALHRGPNLKFEACESTFIDGIMAAKIKVIDPELRSRRGG